MCITKAGFSNNIIFKDFDKSNVQDKKSTDDNVIDLTDQASLNHELSQDIQDKDTMYLKVKDGEYLKVDLSSPENKAIFDSFKGKILSDDGKIRENFLKLAESNPTDTSIEQLFKSVDNPDEQDKSSLASLEHLGKENRSVAELLKKYDTNIGSGGSLRFQNISKQEIADYMVTGKPSENIQKAMELLDRTGEWSALNSVIELNNVRKVYLEKSTDSLNEKINQKTEELNNATNPEGKDKIQQVINNLILDKSSNTDEIADIVKKSHTRGSIAMKKRLAYSSGEIHKSDKKLASLAKKIEESKKLIELVKSDPKKLAEEQKNLEGLQKKYSYIKEHMNTVNHNTTHDAKFMDEIISNREDKGLKIDHHSKELATSVHNVAAKTNITFAKISTRESTSLTDNSAKDVKENLDKVKEHIDKIESYNPEFKQPIPQSKSPTPEDKKIYQEKINARNDLFDLKVDYSKTNRETTSELLEKSGVTNNKGVFEANKEIHNSEQLSNVEKSAIKIYHSEGYKLDGIANTQADILKKELVADTEINDQLKTPEEKHDYTSKVAKVLSYNDISTEIKDEQANVIISDSKAINNSKSLNRDLKAKSEEYKQTAPSADPQNKTEFDLIVEEKNATLDKLMSAQDKVEELNKTIKELPDSDMGNNIKEALLKDQERLFRDIPRLKSQLAENNNTISVLYEKHKELEEGSKREEKPTDHFEKKDFTKASVLNKRIADNQKKLEELEGKVGGRVTGFAINTIGANSVVKDFVNKSKNELIKQIDNDKAAYKKLNINTNADAIKDDGTPEKGSINSIKEDIKNNKTEAAKFSENKELLLETAIANGKVSKSYGFEFDRINNNLSKGIESQEKLLDTEPKWAKTDKEYQTFKANQLYKIADKRTELSPTIAYLGAEPSRSIKIEGYKDKYLNDKFLNSGLGKDVKNMTEEKMQSDAEAESEKPVDNFRDSLKQFEDHKAVNALNKAEEIFNNLKADPTTPLNNDELVDLTKTSVRASNKVASGNAGIDAEVSVQILKHSSENIDKLSGDYKLSNGEVIKSDDLKQALHDEVSETSARSVDIALKRKIIFDGKFVSGNPDLIRSAAQDLLDLAVKEADSVKKLGVPKLKELISKKEQAITKLQENLSKVPESNKEEREKIQSEINTNKKNLETISKFGVASKGAVIAYSVKENYDTLNKKAIEEARDHITKLRQERSKTQNLYNYKIDHVKDKSEDHRTFSFWANTFNSDDFDTDNLDSSLDLINNKYSRQISHVNSFANNYEMAVKNGKGLEFISAMKENREAKELYDNDTNINRDEKYAAVTLKNNESYFKSTEEKYSAQQGQNKMLGNGSRQLLAKFGGINDGTVGGIISANFDKTSYNNWDPTIEAFIKRGGPSENNSIKDSEKETNYYNRSLLAGGYQADLAPVDKMDGKYTDRRLTEMVGIDPHDLAIHTGADWFDDTVNGIGAFLDRPETIEMLVEIAVIEVATMGAGTLLALGAEIKNASNAVKLASKISDFEKASEAVNLATKGVSEAKEALTLAKEAGNVEKVAALKKEIEVAEKGLDLLSANKVKALKNVEDATNVIKKLADKRVREIVKEAKINSSGFVKKSMHKGLDLAKQKVIETAINKTSVAIFGEDSNMNKLVGILSSASKTNKLTSFGDFSSKVLKEFSSQIGQTSTTKLGVNLYAKAVYGISADKLNIKQQNEAELFGSLFSQATSAAASFVGKKLSPEEITPQKEMVDNQMRFLFPGLDPKKMSAAHKDITSALDRLHSSEKLTPEKNMKKLEEFEAAVKKHYPNYESNNRVQEFIKNQTAKVIVRDLDKTNLLDYEKVLKDHFIEHNKNNPDKVFDDDTVNKMTSQLVIQKAVENIKPLEFSPKDIETPQSKKEFEYHISRKTKEIKVELSKVMPNGPQADIVSNMTMKLYISDLANGKNVNADTKKYLNDISNSLEITKTANPVKSDEKVLATPVENKSNIKPTITNAESQNLAKNTIKSFDNNLEKNPQAHKDISESLESFYKESNPEKAREKLDEFKNKIESHYPDAKKSPEKVKAYQLIQEELVKLSISEMKSLPDVSPLEYARDVRMHLEKYNLKNPKQEIENHFIEKAYEDAIAAKAFEGTNKFNLGSDGNFDSKEFEAKIKSSKAEIVNKLSQTMRKDIAENIADIAVRVNLTDIHKNAPDKERKYLDNFIKNETNKFQDKLLLDHHEDDYVKSFPLKHDISEKSFKELEKMNNGNKLIEAYQNIHIASQGEIAIKIEGVMSNPNISTPDKEKIIEEISHASQAYSKRFEEIEVNKKSIKDETTKLINTNKEIESKLGDNSLSDDKKSELKSTLESNSEKINSNLKTLIGMKNTNQMWTEEKRLNEVVGIAIDVHSKKNFTDPKNFTGITKKVYEQLPNIKNKAGDPVFKNIEEFHLATRKLPSELSLEQRDGLKKIRETVSVIPPQGKKIIKVEVGGIYERDDRNKLGGFVVEPEFLSHAKNKEDVIINILRLDYPGSPYLDDNGKLKKGIDIKISVGTVKPDDVKTAYSKEYDPDGIDIISNQYPFGGGSFVLSSGDDQVGTPEYKIVDGKDVKPEHVFRSFDEFKKSLDNKDPVFNQP